MVLVTAAYGQGQARHALIIANEAYAESVGPLNNPHTDARLLRTALLTVGFPADNIKIIRDAGRGAILAGVTSHARRLAQAGPDAVGFLYYSGHGAAKPDTGRKRIRRETGKGPGRTPREAQGGA